MINLATLDTYHYGGVMHKSITPKKFMESYFDG